MVTLINAHNVHAMGELQLKRTVVDLVYADMIYDDAQYSNIYLWIARAYELLREGGIFIVQTDYHTVARVYMYMESIMTFVNWVVYKQEWGGTPRNRFAQKHDDILIFAKGSPWKWYGERIQIAKKTAGTAFDKKGTGLKTPCSVFDDLGNFSTMSKERVKFNGKNIRWQKPLKLMDRLLLPFTDIGDTILDPFMGSNTTGLWCFLHNRDFIGIEEDREIYMLAQQRIANQIKENLK